MYNWSLSFIGLLCLFIVVVEVLFIKASLLEITNNHSFVHIGNVTFVADI